MKNFRYLILLIAALPIAGVLSAGCGNQEAETKKAMETPLSDIDRNKAARAIFDKVGGDQAKLTAEDKAKLKSLFPQGVDISGLFAALSRKAAMPGPPTGK